ncbi:zf-C3HC-domain-containing protein [Trametopsis cervina]|nr:zf-C3HC-domain-containing protein [Trametopsis cervina]
MESAVTENVNPSANTTTQDVSFSTSERALKRKFEDAIHILDTAVRPTSPAAPQPTAKRPRPSGPSRSLYATLAKYGIRKENPEPRLQSLSKNAPHLVELLTRARKASLFKTGITPTPSSIRHSATSEYRPSSTASFLSRLATYKLTTYANKPSAIDAVAAAKCGWVNEGKDRLVCGICNVSWVLANKEGMNRDATNTLVEKQRVQLVSMHKDGCPWKARQCDASIYRVPLSTPASMAKELKVRAIKLDSAMSDVQIKHPLTSAQAEALQGIISSIKLHEQFSFSDDEAPSTADDDSASSAPLPAAFLLGEPSTVAIITALFGWSVLPPSTENDHPRPSLSRSTSLAPTTPGPSRFAASPRIPSRSSTPLSTPRASTFSRHAASPSFASTASAAPKKDATLLHCDLCQRRIGLWAFLPTPPKDGVALDESSSQASQQKRQLDVLKEHRSHCPYVVRSTIIPSPPVNPPNVASASSSHPLTSALNPSVAQVNGQPGELEGWRAVLSVVLRYGAVQKQRLGYTRGIRGERSSMDSSASGNGNIESTQEADPVAAMVEGVKARGGKDLLKYVKGLLG